MRAYQGKVNVCGVDFDVWEVPGNDPLLEKADEGCTNFTACIIAINAEMASARKRLVFAHEVTHAILSVSGAESFIGQTSEANETLVEILAPGMAQLLETCRNPWTVCLDEPFQDALALPEASTRTGN